MTATEQPPIDERFERADSVLVRPERFDDSDEEMDITPMIDVTFLLLIFFMVVSRMDPSRDVRLPVAEFASSVSSRDAIVVTLGETDAANLEIYLGPGKKPEMLLSATSPEAQEAAITDYVRQTKLAQPTVRRIIIQAEKRVAHRDVARVARIAEMAAELPMFVAVMEES